MGFLPYTHCLVVYREGSGPQPREGLWPGVVSAKIVYDSLAAGGEPQPRRARSRPFRVTPLQCGSGVCWFHLLARSRLVEAFLRGLTVEGARVYCRQLAPPPTPLLRGPCRLRVFFETASPVSLWFSGHPLRVPTSRALLVAAARSYRWLHGTRPPRPLLAGLVLSTELLDYQAETLLLDIGGGRLVEAIEAQGTLFFRASRARLIRGLFSLLSSAAVAGIGKNRALGLGLTVFRVEGECGSGRVEAALRPPYQPPWWWLRETL